RVQYPTAGGSAAWPADGSGVYYTRYPNPGERPEVVLHFCQQIWFHKLGTPISEDRYELGKDFPRIAEIAMQTSEDGQWLLSTVGGADSWFGDELVFGNVSYLKPFAWFTFDPATKNVHRTALGATSPVDFDDIEVVREFATSKDGTKVPVNILRKKGLKLDGQ